jgi:hypothetical protein
LEKAGNIPLALAFAAGRGHILGWDAHQVASDFDEAIRMLVDVVRKVLLDR